MMNSLIVVYILFKMFSLRMNGQTLEVVNTHKILGLTLDSQLTWRPHIENVKTKCS
jgi:hypothetical protein